MLFTDRTDAGRQLAVRLAGGVPADAVVAGLPRGGVPVAYEIAQALRLPLDVILVRKLGVPYQPELAMGAIGEDDVRILNHEVLRLAHVTGAELAEIERRERAELERRARRFRGDRPAASLTGRTVVIVDDGIATGSTALAACQVARARGARRIVLATPVAPTDVATIFRTAADEVVCLFTPPNLVAIGAYYRDFRQTSDHQVAILLERAPAPVAAVAGAADEPDGTDTDVEIAVATARLEGHLQIPAGATGIAVFVHGSGSSRHSPRNRHVAATLQERGLGTLLFDLLTAREEWRRQNVFDVELLAGRLLDVTAWLRGRPESAGLRVGYFGASTGAAAALWAAAEPGNDVGAVVSRGGRPDLAHDRLDSVQAPTLLIVGGLDTQVLELNREAQRHLRCESRLETVPGATHLFSEPGALEAVAALAGDWFLDRLVPVRGLAHRPG